MDKNETLEKLHSVLLEVLTEFDRICRKHNIQYFLDSGTALGAVRHGGFIPWDDDIDVGMLRSEYNRFMEIAPKEIGENFYLQHRGVDENYMKEHAKLRKLGTIFPEEGTEELKCRGIFIDIFPFDYMSDNEVVSIIEFWINRKFNELLRLRRLPYKRNTIQKKLVVFFSSFLSSRQIEKIYYRFQTIHNAKKSNRVTSYQYQMVLRRNISFPSETMCPSVSIDFAGGKFSIMNNYHDYLSRMYNDYMTLPPAEKREYHCAGEIIF